MAKALGRHIVMPGQDLTDIIKEVLPSEDSKYVVGPGIMREGKKTKAMVAGLLSMRENPLTFWIHHHQRKYFPINGERVIGTVANKSGFVARLDIGTSDNLSLNLLAFEGATKRNRPNINVGDIVFCRVVRPNRDMEPELVCVTSGLKKDGMGVLIPPMGHVARMIEVSVHTSRNLLRPNSRLLQALGAKYRFEIAVGMNGRIWVAAKLPEHVIFITTSILRSDVWSSDEESSFYDELLGNVEFTLVSKQNKKKKLIK